MRLYLIRHAQSTGNKKGELQGRADTVLSESGIKQARSLSKKLDLNFDIIFSSPLKRAQQTAEYAINQETQEYELELIDGLSEMDIGIFEGVHKSQITEEQKEMWNNMLVNLDYREHKGETLQHFIERVKSSFKQIIAKAQHNNYSTIGVFTHAGVLKILFKFILDIDYDGFENAGVYCIEKINHRWELFDIIE